MLERGDDLCPPLAPNAAVALVLSLSQVTGSMPTSGSAGSVPENLNLFPEPGGKGDEVGKKQLSKDSILSLYGSQTPQLPAQGNGARNQAVEWCYANSEWVGCVLMADKQRCGSVGGHS